MPRSLQLRKLRSMAVQFQQSMHMQDLAEISFASTARLRGFELECIEEIALEYWPEGYIAQRIHHFESEEGDMVL